MTNHQEFADWLESISSIPPDEEQALLDESFEEGFAAFLEGDDAYDAYEDSISEEEE